MIATGNHGFFDSLRDAPLVWQSVLLKKNGVIQLFPLWIHGFNQFILSFSIPALNLFFSFNCGCYIRCTFIIYQLMDVMLGSKTVWVKMMFMFIYPADQIFCYTHIDCNICGIGQYVHIIVYIVNSHFFVRIATPVTSVTGSQ